MIITILTREIFTQQDIDSDKDKEIDFIFKSMSRDLRCTNTSYYQATKIDVHN